MLGLIGGPHILITAILILFDVVDPGDATDVLAVPEILWKARNPGLNHSQPGD